MLKRNASSPSTPSACSVSRPALVRDRDQLFPLTPRVCGSACKSEAPLFLPSLVKRRAFAFSGPLSVRVKKSSAWSPKALRSWRQVLRQSSGVLRTSLTVSLQLETNADNYMVAIDKIMGLNRCQMPMMAMTNIKHVHVGAKLELRRRPL